MAVDQVNFPVNELVHLRQMFKYFMHMCLQLLVARTVAVIHCGNNDELIVSVLFIHIRG